MSSEKTQLMEEPTECSSISIFNISWYF